MSSINKKGNADSNELGFLSMHEFSKYCIVSDSHNLEVAEAAAPTSLTAVVFKHAVAMTVTFQCNDTAANAKTEQREITITYKIKQQQQQPGARETAAGTTAQSFF